MSTIIFIFSIAVLIVAIISIISYKLTYGVSDPHQTLEVNSRSPKYSKPHSDDAPLIINQFREEYNGKSLQVLNDLYFELISKIREADKRGNVNVVLQYSQISLGLIEPLIIQEKKKHGKFNIKSIPAIEKGLIYFAVNGSRGQLKNIQDIVDYFNEIHFYKEKVDEAFVRRDLAAKIYEFVKSNPDCPQKELKTNIDFEDGRLISTTAHYMEKTNKLIRRKDNGKTLLRIN